MKKLFFALAISCSIQAFATPAITCNDEVTYKTYYDQPQVGEYIKRNGHHLVLHVVDGKIYGSDVEAGGQIDTNFWCGLPQTK